MMSKRNLRVERSPGYPQKQFLETQAMAVFGILKRRTEGLDPIRGSGS